jgi:hypothetical protein
VNTPEGHLNFGRAADNQLPGQNHE